MELNLILQEHFAMQKNNELILKSNIFNVHLQKLLEMWFVMIEIELKLISAAK